jgi:DNA-binding MarR family transcriptional regulator
MGQMYETLFGNAVAEKVLLYIANYGEGYINKIAQTYGVSPSQVQKQLVRLEAGGILVSRLTGNLRIFTFNPRLGIRKELITLLEKELELMPKEILQKLYRERRRPRRTGKEL